MLSVTPTKLSDYLNCPLKFKLKHIDKSGGAASSAAFSFGTTMHRALQEIHEKQMLKDGIPSCEGLLKRFWNSSGYATREEDSSYFTRGCHALENYCHTAKAEVSETLGTEVFMSLIIEFKGQKIRLGCRADRLALDQNNRLEIIDYKTSAAGKIPTLEFVRGDLPTFLYFVLARISYPQYPRLKFTYLNVMSGAKVTVEYERDLIDENKKALWECLKTIASDKFTPRSSECCSWCDFQDDCPLTNRVVDFSAI
jgi:putative RecB family exonuclease